MSSANGPRRAGLLLVGCAIAFYVMTAGGSLASSDAVVTYDVTRQLVEHGTVALSSNLVGNAAYETADGKFYSPFGVLQAVWNVPFYVAGKALHAILPGGRIGADMLTKAAVALGNSVTSALVVWLVWFTACSAGATSRDAVAAALVAGFCTSLWPYSKFGFNVPLSALLVTAVGYYTIRTIERGDGPSAWRAGLMCGLALLTRHEFGLLAALSIAGVLLAHWRRSAVTLGAWWAAGALPGALLWSCYNVIRYGSPFDTGYMRDDTLGLGGSIADGLWGLLLSPAGSIFIYSPVVIAALVAVWMARQRAPVLSRWLLATLAVFLVFYAQLGSWAGGRSYGPRYLVPFIPMLCVPVAVALSFGSRRVRSAIIGCALLSAVVQVPGVLVDFSKVRLAYARTLNGATYESRMQEWPASPLMLNANAAVHAVPLVVKHLTGIEPRPPIERSLTADAGRDFSQAFAFSLDFWWITLFYLGVIPGWAAAVVGILLATAGMMFVRAAWVRAT